MMKRGNIVTGIAIGVGAAIAVTTVATGADRPSRRVRAGDHVVIITPADTGRLTLQDVTAITDSATLVTGISPVTVSRTDVAGGSTDWRTGVYGVAASYLGITNRSVARGVPFDKDDVRAHRRYALLGETVASRLFPGRDAFGEWVRIGGVPFTVVGTLASKGRSVDGADQDDVVLVPYTTAQERLPGAKGLAEIVAVTRVRGDVGIVEQEVRHLIRDAHQLPRGRGDDFTITDAAWRLRHA
jgi:putative ABC transport system permease protein